VTIANPSCARDRQGFTLLEILVALMIAGIVLTTVYGAVSRVLKSKTTAEERAELLARGRETVLRMANEIEGAIPPEGGRGIWFRGETAVGETPTDSIQFVAMNRGGFGASGVRPGQVLILYFLEEIPERRDYYRLRREEHSFTTMLAEADGLPLPVDEIESEDEEGRKSSAVPLLDCEELPGELNIGGTCDRLKGLRFRYYDEVVGDFRDRWDTGDDFTLDRIPSAVEITVFLEDERGTIHDFGTIVDLPLARAQPTPEAEDDDESDDEGEPNEDGGNEGGRDGPGDDDDEA
jgi:prepilin-type N-terminal cleavage/methylation domain-containing protein